MEAPFCPADSPYTYVAVVTPMTGDPATSGKIKVLPCAHQIKHRWLTAYQVDAKSFAWAVEPLYQRRGYILLRDLFEQEGRGGGVAGPLKPDASPEEFGWKHWDWCRANGKVFPEAKLPAVVLERRNTAKERRGA